MLATYEGSFGLQVTVYDVCASIAVLEASEIVARGSTLMPNPHLNDLFLVSMLSGTTCTVSKTFVDFCDYTMHWTDYNAIALY